ncbi:MAG: hypothetical protein R3B96_14690 [Pirellulaceae bacterium]
MAILGFNVSERLRAEGPREVGEADTLGHRCRMLLRQVVSTVLLSGMAESSWIFAALMAGMLAENAMDLSHRELPI